MTGMNTDYTDVLWAPRATYLHNGRDTDLHRTDQHHRALQSGVVSRGLKGKCQVGETQRLRLERFRFDRER